MDSLKDLLNTSLLRNSIKPQVEACNALDEFKKLVRNVWGEEVLSMVEPKYVKEFKLFVHCNSSSAASALSLARKKIVEELNKNMGSEAVKDIIFFQ